VVVREFEEADRTALQRIYLESRRYSFTWLDVESYKLDDFDKHTVGEKIWLGQVENEVVAFIAVDIAENYIHHLFVLPSRTGNGYGSSLLNSCLEEIGRPARLKCLSRNTPAVKFYERLGWRTTAIGTDPRDGDYRLMEYET